MKNDFDNSDGNTQHESELLNTLNEMLDQQAGSESSSEFTANVMSRISKHQKRRKLLFWLSALCTIVILAVTNSFPPIQRIVVESASIDGQATVILLAIISCIASLSIWEQ